MLRKDRVLYEEIRFTKRIGIMRLSNNFRLSEFTRSDTAKRLGIENECSSVEQVLNLAGGPTPSLPQGEGVVTTVSTAPANCPPETGGTRSEATEGVDDTNGNRKTIHPLPPAGYSPLYGRESDYNRLLN